MLEYPLLDLKSALYYTLWQLEHANKNECKISLNMINKTVWGLWIKGSNYIVAFYFEKAETKICNTSWEINKLNWPIKLKKKHAYCVIFSLKSIQKGQLPWAQPVNYVCDFQKRNNFPTINPSLWFLNSCYLDLFSLKKVVKGRAGTCV